MIDTQWIVFKDWTVRVRQATRQPARLLILLHGWTGDENSMWVFARELPSTYWMVAPRAPHKVEPTGYSWRPSPNATFAHPTLERFRESAGALIKFVDEYSASVGIEASTFDVMGFSQGAAMTNVLTMLYPQRIRRAGILAGFVPSETESIIAARPLEGKHLFVAHGTLDEMVPVDRARASIALLEQAGAQVTYCEDEVGHKVSLACLRALRDYLLG